MPLLDSLSAWLIPLIVCLVPLWGTLRGVNVYEAFVEGAQEGFGLSLRILPYMVAIFLAVGVFRAAGAMAALTRALDPVLHALGIPAAVVPQILIRPLSGTASLGVMADILRRAGPDTLVGKMASVIQGSTDTTFYILAVYLGSVGIRRARYALPMCLLGDAAGLAAAVALSRLLWSR